MIAVSLRKMSCWSKIRQYASIECNIITFMRFFDTYT